MTLICALKQVGRWTFAIFIRATIFVYVLAPITIYLSPFVRRHIIYCHYFNPHWYKNLSSPQLYGLSCALHFFIPSNDNIRLGAWYIPAANAICIKDLDHFKEEISDNKLMFLYLHGNAATRGEQHRIDLYRILSEKIDAHVITFDYRGFGDSTNVNPDQDGIVIDAIHAYNWLRKYVDSKRIFIWGHSLGTGVATALLYNLSQTNEEAGGLILEAPFTTFVDVVKHHATFAYHHYIPYFHLIMDSFARDTRLFDCISKINYIKASVLILHAEDDAVVPFSLGRKLYEDALLNREKMNYLTKFCGFESKLGYGHQYICRDKTLPTIIKQFIENSNSVT